MYTKCTHGGPSPQGHRMWLCLVLGSLWMRLGCRLQCICAEWRPQWERHIGCVSKLREKGLNKHMQEADTIPWSWTWGLQTMRQMHLLGGNLWFSCSPPTPGSPRSPTENAMWTASSFPIRFWDTRKGQSSWRFFKVTNNLVPCIHKAN